MIPSLFEHQKKAVEFITQRRGGSGALFMEMGTGKTRCALQAFAELREKDQMLTLLVICPISLIEAAWAEDNDKYTQFSFRNLRKDFSWGHHINIFAMNYEMFLNNQPKIITEILNKNAGNWMVVLDESSRIKNSQSQITKALLKMKKYFKHRVIMSGTPAPNSEMEYWPQMNFIEDGILGESMTSFRSQFFHLQNRYTKQVFQNTRFRSKQEAMDVYRKCDYKITKDKRETLMAMIKPYCFTIKKDECLDLPPEVDEYRRVDLSYEQRVAYDEMRLRLVTEIRDQVIAAPVALTKLMKMRQIVGGFIYTDAGESLEISLGPDLSKLVSDSTEKEFPNPKLNELFDVIEEAGKQPVIIWIQFHWEMIKICHELAKKYPTEKVVTMSALTKDKDGSIQSFKNGEARFMVAHPASAAHGLTFINCSLQIFYSLDYSWEKYEQARARTHRAGQTRSCTYVHLIAKNTVDEALLGVLKKKGDGQDLIYEFMKNSEKNSLANETSGV